MTIEFGRYPSPLRYPGGKGKIANFIKLVMIQNDMVGGEYVEPYAGGASVALELLFEEFAGHVHINDLNPAVHAFWQTVLNDCDELCDLIESTPVTMRTWHAQREIYNAPGARGIELAFATFFLNRTNRSGILSGGVIGGIDQSGAWKLDARYNKSELIRRIRKVHRHRQRITLTHLDAAALLAELQPTLAPGTLIYLDPPYFVKGEGLYDNFYGPRDHETIASLVRGMPADWIVSYDNHSEIRRMYAGCASIQYGLSYSAHRASQGREVMFFSPKLEIPGVAPAGLSARAVADALAT